jgi:Fe-S-cluster containining protein
MDFVGFAKLGKENPYNFKIDGSESSYCLVLNMKELPNGNRRCIFVLDLPDPVVRCGIYSCRPIACRAYPLILKGKQVVIKPWALCSKNVWDKSQFEMTYWRQELQRHDMEFSIHASLVAKWNADMQTQPKMTTLNFRPFFDYFFEVYKQLEPVRAEISEEVWPGIWQQWRNYTGKGLNPLFLGTNGKVKTTGWSFWLHGIENAILQAKQNC